jgi:hypothetical protein
MANVCRSCGLGHDFSRRIRRSQAAPGIADPLESFTVPETFPVTAAEATAPISRKIVNNFKAEEFLSKIIRVRTRSPGAGRTCVYFVTEGTLTLS